jgi:hypothetical protein
MHVDCFEDYSINGTGRRNCVNENSERYFWIFSQNPKSNTNVKSKGNLLYKLKS